MSSFILLMAKASMVWGFLRSGALERNSLSGPVSSRTSPLVESWIWFCSTRSRSSQCLRNHCFYPSPIDALVHVVIRCRFGRQIPVWLGLHPIIHLRITTATQQRWSAWREAMWAASDSDFSPICPSICLMAALCNEASGHRSTGTAAKKFRRYKRSTLPTGIAPSPVWVASVRARPAS